MVSYNREATRLFDVGSMSNGQPFATWFGRGSAQQIERHFNVPGRVL